VFETGRLARLAGGAAVVRHGCDPPSNAAAAANAANAAAPSPAPTSIEEQHDPAAQASRGTVVLATACMADGRPPLPDADGAQLQVDVRERYYSAGRLPLQRVDRREPSGSERELLAARLIDRALRPLFPPGALYEVQVTATILAADGGTDAAVAAVNAASAALALSEAPWAGPAAAVRVAATTTTTFGGGGGGGGGGGRGGGGKGGGASSSSSSWDILVDPPAAAWVGGALPRRAGSAAPWPALTPGPLLMAALPPPSPPSDGRRAGGGAHPHHRHHHHRHPPAPPPTCGLLLTYAGTAGGDVLMLEAQGAPAPEEVVVTALRRAQAEAAGLAAAQQALVARAGRPKASLLLMWPSDELSAAVEQLARPQLEAIFSGGASSSSSLSSGVDGGGGSRRRGGGGGGGGGGSDADDPWAAAPWLSGKERRAAALGALQGRVMRGLTAQGLLPDAHSMPSAVGGRNGSNSSSNGPLYSASDAARALDVLTSRVMREALLAGCGHGTGLVDVARSARPSAVVAPAGVGGGESTGSSSSSSSLPRRADGRLPTEIRPVSCEAGVLPRVVHGSALFDRGDTQCLAAATVAAERDAPLADGPHGRSARRLMLHYSFPPFSVGETGRMMGAPPNRREVGHGALAEKALAPLLPPAGGAAGDDSGGGAVAASSSSSSSSSQSSSWPFCVRVACETLASSGSSSMAAVCAGTMAMRAAGVPLSDDAAGVSIGLAYERPPQLVGGGGSSGSSSGSAADAAARYAADAATAATPAGATPSPPPSSSSPFLPEHPRYGRGVLLTDIEGMEDHHGDMDLKVAGTHSGGITALQLDTKLPGIPVSTLERALQGPALAARRDLLAQMKRAVKLARDRLPSARAKPRTGEVSVARELVPRLIGVAGCNLEAIEAATGGRLSVSESGSVGIYAPTGAQWDHAATAVLEVEGGSVVEGGVYRVRVVRIVDYGCYVSLPNGMPALLHISELEHRRLKDVHEAVEEGEEFDVLCLGRDPKGLVQLSRRALLPKPPGYGGGNGGGSSSSSPSSPSSSGGSTQQAAAWTLPAYQYSPEEAATRAEAALGAGADGGGGGAAEGGGSGDDEDEGGGGERRRGRKP
jgi:polyribonucleotide nucleotidyltransferase